MKGRMIYVLLILAVLSAGVILTEEKDAGIVDSGAQVTRGEDADNGSAKKENEGWEEMDTNPLTETADADIAEAVEEYYETQRAENPFVEEYRNLLIYTKDGRYAGTHVVFVRFEMKIKDIYTAAPGMETLYMEQDGRDGREYIVSAADPDRAAEIQEAAETAAGHEDAEQLMAGVQADYEKALAADAMLRESLGDLEEAYEENGN